MAEYLQSSTKAFRHLRKMSLQPNWKAREYLLWIVFYCVPCVKGLLKNRYLVHLSLLSAAMNILLQRSHTDRELMEAERYLWCYTAYYQKYFGEKRMVYNIHLLSSHLIKSIKDFGPIWGFSAFPFEAQNHNILMLAKNHATVALEIATKFVAYQSLPQMCSSAKLSPSTSTFVRSVLKNKMLSNCVRAGNCVLLGKPVDHNSFLNSFSPLSQRDFSHGQFYKRILYKRSVYVTVSYCSGRVRNDSCVFLISGEFAFIHNFFVLEDKSVKAYVEILKLQRQPIIRSEHVKLCHLKKIEGFGERKCVNIDDILEPCFLLKTGGCEFVSRLPYGCTVE